MKKFAVILILMISAICNSQREHPNREVNVLFIGNSLTYYHQMPETVQKMIDETNLNIKIEQITYPGMSLSGHLDNIIELRTENSIETRKKQDGELTETEKKIAEKDWDLIVLQEGTVRLLIPEAREYKVIPAIAEIKKRLKNPTCKIILFQTWPSKKEYPKQYCYSKWAINHSLEKETYCSPKIENLEQEIKLINEAYEIVAEENGLIKSENGNKFYELITKHPEVELYEDNIHPNKYGSFLNACIFYQLITGKKAAGLKYNAAIEPTIATLLKKAAK